MLLQYWSIETTLLTQFPNDSDLGLTSEFKVATWAILGGLQIVTVFLYAM